MSTYGDAGMGGRNPDDDREPSAEHDVERPGELDEPLEVHFDVGDLRQEDQDALATAYRARQRARYLDPDVLDDERRDAGLGGF